MFAAATKQKSFSKPRGKSLKSQRAAVKTFDEEGAGIVLQMAGAAVGNYHNIVSQSLSLLSLFLSLSLSRCSQSNKAENVVGPATPIFNVRDLTRREDERETRSLVHFRGIGIGIGYVQLLELPCTYLHWATTVN